jgi:peptide deformylase
MALLPILCEPNPRLREISKPIETITPDILRLLDDMVETMANDAGLAAPQVNHQKRLFVMNITGELFKIINPKILWKSSVVLLGQEGCLSIPGESISVPRAEAITVQFLDPAGILQERSFSGLESVCFQHESDHLDGILAIDYLSPLKRSLYKRRSAKRALHNRK